MKRIITLFLIAFACIGMWAKDYVPAPYTWTTQSKNSSESMPCGGHDIGMNVWVEQGDVLVYLSRSGFFDENNTLLKAGRLRLKVDGNPFNNGDFQQTLCLDDGAVYIKGGGVTLRLWADVKEPVVYADIQSAKPVNATLSYESWRHHDRLVPKEACQQFSWKWLTKGEHATFADSINATKNQIIFQHKNRKETVFDFTVNYERMDAVKDQIADPIGSLCFGGRMTAPGFTYQGTTEGTYASTDYRAWNFRGQNLKHTVVAVELACAKETLPLNNAITPSSVARLAAASAKRSSQWWHSYWQRSYIKSTNSEAAHIARNYELFRYMLGCNAYGMWPTKFNGGLFTFDPVYVQDDNPFTPDFRCWGGGTMTAQNQRLVYWPMLKSGDFDMMASQFDTYLRMLPAAQLRSKYYWNHDGACFEEQIENFGLPNPAEYGKHKEGQDYGWQNNKWLEYLYDTSLEFCQMILLANEYNGMDITKYRPLVTQCIKFFDEHYQMLAKQRGATALTEDGKLVIYPGSGAETYKMAYNPSSTVAGLRYVLETIDKKHGGLAAWDLDTALISRIPEIPLREVNGKTCIAPATTWMRIQNVESPQLYPVFPWRVYGLGRPDIEIAKNTYHEDDYVQQMRSSRGWKQDNIWAPLLGEEKDARQLCIEKFEDGPYRFPAFWERGFDWAPDHNRGGSAMIGLEEMLLQEKENGELMPFACWPKDWDAEFRLHATGGRVVDAKISEGKVSGTVTTTPVNAASRVKPTVTPLDSPLRITIFGDSYSTFEGYITPYTNEPWYFYPDSPGKCKDNDVTRADQTWWYQLIERMGARLETNNSYSGSTIGYTGYIIPETGKHDDYKPRSFITRAPNLGNPDLILCCAGTNDSWDGEEIGEYKYSDWTEQDLYTFRPAMAKFCSEIKRLYPTTRFVFILNCDLKPETNESVHTILEHYGMECLDLQGIDKQAGHPSVKGMKQFADQVYEYLMKTK